ncbi:ComF family protein [Patescibacteria group bacterium]
MDALDLIFPKKCLECGKGGSYICEDCIKKVPLGGWFFLPGLKVYSIWRYRGVVRGAIISLKYKFATQLAKELIDYVAPLLHKRKFLLNDKKHVILIPVALHKKRSNFRGFNQSELIGKEIAKKMKWGYYPNLVIRKKNTTPQAQLSGSFRRENIHNAFCLNPNIKIPKSKVIIFDDVLTTGSTLLEVSKALKEGGRNKVFGLTLAR